MWIAMIDEILFGADRLDGLKKVTARTLVIVGEQDTPFIRPSRRMAETVAGAQLTMIPDAGHSPQFENPDVWWDAVTAFLGSL
jgi:pimeloyl-ACP methyl ester carboxylesterase